MRLEHHHAGEPRASSRCRRGAVFRWQLADLARDRIADTEIQIKFLSSIFVAARIASGKIVAHGAIRKIHLAAYISGGFRHLGPHRRRGCIRRQPPRFHGRTFLIALGVAAASSRSNSFSRRRGCFKLRKALLADAAAYLGRSFPLCGLVYSLSATGSATWLLIGAAYAVLPALLLASSAGKSPGTWEDYAALLLIVLPAVLPVPVRLLYRVFPYPPPLTHTLAILMAISAAVAAFVLLRRLDGIGYAVAWGRGFAVNFALHFAVFAAIAIPLGMKLGFLVYQPSLARARSSPLTVWESCSSPRGPRNFYFVDCCRICFRVRWKISGRDSLLLR